MAGLLHRVLTYRGQGWQQLLPVGLGTLLSLVYHSSSSSAGQRPSARESSPAPPGPGPYAVAALSGQPHDCLSAMCGAVEASARHPRDVWLYACGALALLGSQELSVAQRLVWARDCRALEAVVLPALRGCPGDAGVQSEALDALSVLLRAAFVHASSSSSQPGAPPVLLLLQALPLVTAALLAPFPSSSPRLHLRAVLCVALIAGHGPDCQVRSAAAADAPLVIPRPAGRQADRDFPCSHHHGVVMSCRRQSRGPCRRRAPDLRFAVCWPAARRARTAAVALWPASASQPWPTYAASSTGGTRMLSWRWAGRQGLAEAAGPPGSDLYVPSLCLASLLLASNRAVPASS